MATNIDPTQSGESRPHIISVSLRPAGELSHYLADAFELRRGARVVVETDAGTCLATVQVEPHQAAETLDVETLKPILRLADGRDLEVEEENRQFEAVARRICLTRIRERRLDMKLISVDCTHDGRKAVFYFTSEGRVDFRELVRDLATSLRVRIEMRQIGARDEAKLAGGMGPCGRELCCSSWMRDFDGVTLKMAREQGLALNPSRLAGLCGRLKCCLRFEYSTYLELKRSLPSVGKMVESLKGEGKVLRHNTLKQTVVVQCQDGATFEATLEDLVAKLPQ